MKEHDGTTYLRCANCGAYVVEGEWEAHQCEEIPKDIQEVLDRQHCDSFDTDFPTAVEALDEEVHDLMSIEASGINNEGLEAQIKWLRYEAGVPWSEIRRLIGMKED